MKIAFVALNQNFCGSILEELESKHTVKNFRPSGNMSLDYFNLMGLINWCDLIYCDFIQTPMPEITHMQSLGKPLVARMDGIDILNHRMVDWRNVSALVLMPIQEKRLNRLRRTWTAANPGQKLLPLPKNILKRNVGIDLRKFQPDLKKKPEYKIVLHATVIRDTKGVYEAIQTFHKLLEEDPGKPWQFTIIGQWEGGYLWPQRREYVMCCQELIEDLQFPQGRLGIIPTNLSRSSSGSSWKSWPRYLKNEADFYWCFSKREGFPNSLGEGMASGVVPVMNKFYGAELLYPDEFLCSSPHEILEKTIEFGNLSEEERQNLRREVRAHIEKFDRHKTAVDIRTLCEEVYQNVR